MRSVPRPRRERRATCDKDDGATLQTADHRPGFCVLGVSIASVHPGEAPIRSTATVEASTGRRSWLRTGLWGANDARECSQEEGKEEGKEPSPGAHERNQAAARAIRPGRTTGFEDLRAQPAPGRLQEWASPSSASIWGHLNRRRRPQARSHVKTHEILTASMVLIRCVKVTVGSCLGVNRPTAECPPQTTASELQVENRRHVTRGVAD